MSPFGRFKSNLWFALGLSFTSTLCAHVGKDSTSDSFLIQQLRLGDLLQKVDMTQYALERLESMQPDNPEVISARIKWDLLHGRTASVTQQLNRLKNIAGANSEQYKKASILVHISGSQGQRNLQEARILAVSGKTNEAKKIYDRLFLGTPPTFQFEAEYWMLLSRIPAQLDQAKKHLLVLYSVLREYKLLPDDLSLTSASLQCPLGQPKQINGEITWIKSLAKILSDLQTQEGLQQLKKENTQLAQQRFVQAYAENPNNTSALIGLGDVSFKKGAKERAEYFYQCALRIDPDSNMAIYSLYRVYASQSSRHALDYLMSLPKKKQAKYLDLEHQLKSKMLEQDALQLIAHKKSYLALKKYREAKQLQPNDVWLHFHMAQLMYDLGLRKDAKQMLDSLSKKNKENPEVTYAYALYLVHSNEPKEASKLIHDLPTPRWTPSIVALDQQIKEDALFSTAKQLREQGHKEEAKTLLLKTPSLKGSLFLADWAFEEGSYRESLALNNEILHEYPHNYSALLGSIEALIALKQYSTALKLLRQLPKNKKDKSTINELRRIANAWSAVGEKETAKRMFLDVKKQAIEEKNGQDSALAFRDSALLNSVENDPNGAIDDYRHALLTADVTPVYAKTNESFTRATRANSNDDWLKKSIKSGAANTYRQQMHQVTANRLYLSLPGSKGTSQENIDDRILGIEGPFHQGRLKLRSDYVTIDAGNFSRRTGSFSTNFGTCGQQACTSGFSQVSSGYSSDLSWTSDRWAADLGFTPLGFRIVNMTGGLAYKNKCDKVGFSVGVEQRPLINSLLSFAGAQDPNTKITWGGVVATGPIISLSYDQGGANGAWGQGDGATLTGRNVENNSRFRLMGGVYHKYINTDSRRLSVGVSSMYWHYQNDLSGYTLGQGGYYSPKKLLSVALPVNYHHRTINWSYEIGSSISWSKATTNDNVLYPIANLAPPQIGAVNSVSPGNTSSAIGYTFSTLLERRLGTYFTLGGLFDLQRSPYYAPSAISLYLRYVPEGWQGDMDELVKPKILQFGN